MNTQVVQPACLILEGLAGETFPLVQYDFVDLVYTLLEMAASRLVYSLRVSALACLVSGGEAKAIHFLWYWLWSTCSSLAILYCCPYVYLSR